MAHVRRLRCSLRYKPNPWAFPTVVGWLFAWVEVGDETLTFSSGRLVPGRVSWTVRKNDPHEDRRGPRRRRVLLRTDLHHRRRASPRPLRSRPRHTPGRPAGRDHQAHRPPTPADTRSSPSSTPASRCATCRKPRPTPIHAPPCATTGPGSSWAAMPPTSPEQPADLGFWVPAGAQNQSRPARDFGERVICASPGARI